MPYSGKSTYDSGANVAELSEDISEIVSIISPWETPLLNVLGDPRRNALSTIHEWIEDELLANTDTVNQTSFIPNATDCTSVTVANASRFQVGDLVRPDGANEVMQVTAIAAPNLTVVRQYGGSPGSALANSKKLYILGNAALEGAAAIAARSTVRQRKQNYTQIFTATIDVSGSMQAVRKVGVSDEVDYQKQERIRELLRDLENTVINGVAPSATVQGSASVRRSMNGIVKQIATNRFVPNANGVPTGGGGGTDLNENVLNYCMKQIWETAGGNTDTIVVGGAMKRRINQFVASTSRFYAPADQRMGERIGVYESDFGTCRVVLSRWMPSDSLLLLDSSRIEVLPLVGRSFQYRELARTGDSIQGQLVGEYTLEFRNEAAHGMIRGLT